MSNETDSAIPQPLAKKGPTERGGPIILPPTELDFDIESLMEPDPESEKIADFFEMLRATYTRDRTQTIKLEIPEEIFDHLQDRPGIKGPGFNRTFKEVDGDKVGWYLMFTPYVNVSELRRLGRPEDEHYIHPIVSALGMFAGEEVTFEIAL